MANKKPATLKAFLDYSRRKWTQSDWGMSDADYTEESDRSIVVLMSTRVEDALKFILTKNMPGYAPKLEESLFGGYKPLSTFSAKIDVADAFGLITAEEAKKLHYLRDIRNSCAHTDKHVSFEIREMRDAAELIVPNVIRARLPTATDQETARIHFIGVSSFFCAQIYLGRENALTAFMELFEKDVYPAGPSP